MAGESILIVEDERAVARGLEYGLSKEGYTTFCAYTGHSALEISRMENPHLILLDIRLPDISGHDICRQLRLEGFRQPILILTASDAEVDKVLGLELGADDYVVKPYNLRELIARIRALMRRAYGDLSLSQVSKRYTFGDIELDTEQIQVRRKGQTVYLTSTEFRLLHFLVTHPQRPFDRSTLIEKVWGYDSSIGSERTVDVHIRHLREKLEQDPSNPTWIVTVRGIGYKFQPVPPVYANAGK